MNASPNHAKFAEALAARRGAAPVVVPHVVGGEESLAGPEIRRENPSASATVMSICHDAPAELVQRAVAVSRA